MKVEMRTYRQDDVQVREQMVPSMFVVIDTYTPHSTPWDCYGNKHTREIKQVLLAAGIESVSLVTSETRIHPQGSGPQGRIRFGDNMMPGVYRVAVSKYKTQEAEVAIACHKNAIADWLDGSGDMPPACRD